MIKQYLRDQLKKSSRHTEISDNIFSNHESQFHPYNISKQPIVTHVQSNKEKTWHEVRGCIGNAEKFQLLKMQQQTWPQKQQTTDCNPSKE